jgi:hypothetical protein
MSKYPINVMVAALVAFVETPLNPILCLMR